MKKINFVEFLIVSSGWTAKFYNKKEANRIFASLEHGIFYGITFLGNRELLISK